MCGSSRKREIKLNKRSDTKKRGKESRKKREIGKERGRESMRALYRQKKTDSNIQRERQS